MPVWKLRYALISLYLPH